MMTITLPMYRIDAVRLRPHPGKLPTIYVRAPSRYDAITMAYDYLGTTNEEERSRYSIGAVEVHGLRWDVVDDDRNYQELFESEDML